MGTYGYNQRKVKTRHRLLWSEKLNSVRDFGGGVQASIVVCSDIGNRRETGHREGRRSPASQVDGNLGDKSSGVN